jgi:hypothetical protein
MLNHTQFISALALLSSSLILPLRAEEELADDAIHYSDCHIHLLNFLQGGEFQNDDKKFPGSRWGEVGHQRFLPLPAGQRWRRISGLLYAMDRDHIDYAMICGMPVSKKWADNETFERPDGYLDNESHVLLASDTDLSIAAAVHEYQQEFADDEAELKKLSRVAPFVCGFDPTDLGAVDQVVARIQEYPGVWQGIGEIMSRHDDLTHLQLGERPRSNHPAMLRVCKFAGENFLPVSLHHNIAPISRPGTTKPPVYLDELIELFRYCHVEPGSPSQSTVFIWCHAGASRRVKVENLPYWIDEVLASFGDHVYIDLSWVVWDNYIQEDIPAWVKLIENYPTRFMLGSDVVGGSSTAGKTIRQFEPLLEELDEETRALVARDNYVQLMKRMADLRRTAKLCEKDCPGITLPVDYRYPEYADMPRLRDDESFVRSRLKREGK